MCYQLVASKRRKKNVSETVEKKAGIEKNCMLRKLISLHFHYIHLQVYYIINSYL